MARGETKAAEAAATAVDVMVNSDKEWSQGNDKVDNMASLRPSRRDSSVIHRSANESNLRTTVHFGRKSGHRCCVTILDSTRRPLECQNTRFKESLIN